MRGIDAPCSAGSCRHFSRVNVAWAIAAAGPNEFELVQREELRLGAVRRVWRVAVFDHPRSIALRPEDAIDD